MMPYEVGRWLTRAYYKASPTVVAWFEAHPWLKVPARLLLWLAIGVAWLIQASWKVQLAVGVSAAGLTMAFKLGVGSWLWSINLVRGLLAIAELALASALFASSQAQTGDLLFFHNDHQGTAQVITDESQTVVWQGEQQPFGEVTTSVSSQENPTRLPGQYYDGESGLHYNYFRDYDPSLGRYVQSDPIGLQGGLNTYIYVHNNPIILIDVTGKFVLLSLLTTLYDFSYLSTSACFKGGCETSSVGFADCSAFQIGSKGFLVVGGTIADRTAAQYSMEDIFSTP